MLLWQIYEGFVPIVAPRPRRFVHIPDATRTTQVYHALLYYAFVPIDNPEEFANTHRELCQRLELKGRILVSTEGINGTVSGPILACDQYRMSLHEDQRFSSMPFKIDEVDGHIFQKLFVRVKQ